MNIQFKKGVLELLVLAKVSKRDQYGYDISDSISQTIQIAAGTVYPILRKLKEEGLVTTYLSETSGGPPRKYYKITELGQRKLFDTKKDWVEFVDAIFEILEENENE
jgi:PadR family transcriptional regulator PadR